MKIYMLGCNGWIPGKNETSCFLVEEQESLIMLDAGTGVANLRKYLDVLKRYDTISIVLSHYHLDHIIGLIYILPYIKKHKLNIYGPGKPVYQKSTIQYLDELLQPTFFSREILQFANEVNCYDYKGKDFKIGNVFLKVAQQNHSSPSFRITINDKLIYATDTIFEPSDWCEYDRNSTLLHECWELNSKSGSKHTSLQALVTGLPENIRKSAYLIHLNPEWDKEEWEQIEKIVEGTGISLSYDGMFLTI